jgi:hypothetical protein
MKRTVEEFRNEFADLRQRIADLQYQVQLNAYSINMLQPDAPAYDYDMIKSRKKVLHSEFHRINKLSKLMKLG